MRYAENGFEIRFGFGLAVVLMAGVAACGGDPEGLSSSQLATEMNQICVDNAEAFDEIGHPENFQEIAAMTPQLIEVFDGTLARMGELEVGDADFDAFTEFVTLGHQQSELMGRLQAVAVAEDGAGFEVVAGEMGVVAERSEVVATDLGANECLG